MPWIETDLDIDTCLQYDTVINDDTDGHGNYGVVWKGPYAGAFPLARKSQSGL